MTATAASPGTWKGILRGEYRVMHDPGDPWRSAMGAWFDLCAELYHRGGPLAETWLDRWHYRPGACAEDLRDHDAPMFETFAEAPTGALVAFGVLLDRYVRMLRSRGFADD